MLENKEVLIKIGKEEELYVVEKTIKNRDLR